MRVFVLVNRIREIGATQTTTLLINESKRRGLDTIVTDIFSLAHADHQRFEITGHQLAGKNSVSPDAFKECQNPRIKKFTIQKSDLFLIRTSPGRDEQHLSHHLTWLQILIHFKKMDFRIVNDPETLLQLISKSYLLGGLHRWLPQGFIACAPLSPSNERRVAKPVFGSRGIGVHLVEPNEGMTEGEDVLCVQEFLSDIMNGEHRVLSINGKLIRKGSVVAAYRKKAKPGEFRHNLAQGAVPIKSSMDEEQLSIAEEIGQWSFGQNLKFVGMDVVGNSLLELNVFSPGGIDAIKKTTGEDFTEVIFNALADV